MQDKKIIWWGVRQLKWRFLPRLDSPQVQNWKVWWWNESLRKWWLGLTKTAASFGLVEVYLQDKKGEKMILKLKYILMMTEESLKAFLGACAPFEKYNPPPSPPPKKKGTSLGLHKIMIPKDQLNWKWFGLILQRWIKFNQWIKSSLWTKISRE